MSLFDALFRKKERAESVVLIDINADSVAGAYARYVPDERPVLLYTRRLPIEVREGEPHGRAMLRALKILGDILIREGASALRRASGSGTADSILVSVDAPWQKTSVRTERFEQKTPFVFTKRLVTAALEKTRVSPSGKILVDESVISTTLNGYETRDPYGKSVRRASIVILTSLIDEDVAESIFSTLRGLYHTKNILSIAGSSLRSQAMRIAFPHERDAIILDATGALTSIALVRKDLLVDLIEVADHAVDVGAWLQRVTKEFTGLAERFPLPRTIFLLAREQDIARLREALDAAHLGTLWLSDNPPRIVSVPGSHFSGSIQHAAATISDLPLLLMTLFFQHRALEKKA